MTTVESVNALYKGSKTCGLPFRNLSAVRRLTGEVMPNRSILEVGTARFYIAWPADKSRRRLAALNSDAVELARIMLQCSVELVDGSGVCTKAEYFSATGTVAHAVKAAQTTVAEKKVAK